MRLLHQTPNHGVCCITTSAHIGEIVFLTQVLHHSFVLWVDGSKCPSSTSRILCSEEYLINGFWPFPFDQNYVSKKHSVFKDLLAIISTTFITYGHMHVIHVCLYRCLFVWKMCIYTQLAGHETLP